MSLAAAASPETQSFSAQDLDTRSQATQVEKGDLRSGRPGDIVPVMPGSTKREIRDQDVQGLKCLPKIRPLLSRLRKVGTERDKAGNRRLFMDQYCALILMSLFSPAIESLRDLQRACALEKARKRLGVSRASLGSLSESVAIFDPAPLKGIAAEFGRTIRRRPDRRFDSIGQQITALDGAGAATASRARGVRCCAGDCRPSEELPVPREPGYGSKRGQDGEAQRTCRERRA